MMREYQCIEQSLITASNWHSCNSNMIIPIFDDESTPNLLTYSKTSRHRSWQSIEEHRFAERSKPFNYAIHGVSSKGLDHESHFTTAHSPQPTANAPSPNVDSQSNARSLIIQVETGSRNPVPPGKTS